MSELFAVHVVEVTRESAVLEVHSVHPDSGPPRPTATFALMLMYDPIINSGYSDFQKYRHIEASPLAQAMDRDDYLNGSWIPANARAFVAKVKVSRGVLTIWPTHPAWIEHLRAGMNWSTAAYSAGPGQAAPPRAPAAPGGPVVRASDPAAGFRVGAPKIDGCKLMDAFIALHGPSRYVAEPVLTDPAAMARAARKLMGKPVLVVPIRGPSEIGTIVEVRDTGVYLYRESEWGWGAGTHNFKELKSLGRAWLKVQGAASVVNPASQTTKPAAAKKATKKTTSKKVAKVAAKPATGKATKVAAKPATRKATKVAAKPATRKVAKVTGKPATRKVAKVTAKRATRKVAKVAAKRATRKVAKK